MSAIDDNPLVSIIVPVYKVEEYLHNCVDSIINQTYQNLEIILIDDGSPDNCGQICDEYVEKDERIKVIHQENKGLSSARNTGLDICRGNYIAFVDSDDWVDSNFIEAMLEYANENTIVHCGYYIHNEKKVSHIFSDKILFFSNFSIIKELTDSIPKPYNFLNFAVWTKLYPKSIFLKLRFPQGMNFEDLYLYVDIMHSLPNCLVLNKPLYHYNVRLNSICKTTTVKNMNDHLKARLKFESDTLHLFPDLDKIKLSTLLNCINLLADTYVNNSKMPIDFKENIVQIIQQRYDLIPKHNIKLQIKYYMLIYTPWLYPIFSKLWQSRICMTFKEHLCKSHS